MASTQATLPSTSSTAETTDTSTHSSCWPTTLQAARQAPCSVCPGGLLCFLSTQVSCNQGAHMQHSSSTMLFVLSAHPVGTAVRCVAHVYKNVPPFQGIIGSPPSSKLPAWASSVRKAEFQPVQYIASCHVTVKLEYSSTCHAASYPALICWPAATTLSCMLLSSLPHVEPHPATALMEANCSDSSGTNLKQNC
jgi:hypothetical protein